MVLSMAYKAHPKGLVHSSSSTTTITSSTCTNTSMNSTTISNSTGQTRPANPALMMSCRG